MRLEGKVALITGATGGMGRRLGAAVRERVRDRHDRCASQTIKVFG